MKKLLRRALVCLNFATLSFHLIAAEPAPDFLWAQQGGGSETDVASAITVDPFGNTYITGYFSGLATLSGTPLTSSGDSDVLIAKYNTNGALLWARKAGGTEVDAGSGIAVDIVGNIYVVGQFKGTATFDAVTIRSAGESDIFLAKYDAAGNLVWVRRAGGIGVDSGVSVGLDSSGHVYVTGQFSDSAMFGGTTLIGSGDADAFVAKYDGSGNQLWVRKAGGPGLDSGTGLAIDTTGDLYIVGYFVGTATFSNTSLTSTGGTDAFTAKYDSSGRLVWAAKSGGTSDDFGNAITVDSSGAVFVTGSFRGQASFGSSSLTARDDSDIFLAKYSGAGQLQWLRQAGGVDSDSGNAVAVDSSGNAYVAGSFGTVAIFGTTNSPVNLTSSGSSDIFVAKFDSTGVFVSAARAGGDRFDAAMALAVDSAGDTYLAGLFGGAATFGAGGLAAVRFEDLFVAKAAVNRLPVITIQPRSQVLLTGANAILSVSATGTQPLSYQWFVNNAPMPNQTNSTLVLNNVSAAVSGVYTVAVTNMFGLTGSGPATLAVTSRRVRVDSTFGFAGETNAVPISLVGQGDENTVSFSLAFDTNLVKFLSVSNGLGAPVGLNTIVNTNQTGRVGIAVALPTGVNFGFGTNEIMKVYFQTAAGAGASNNAAILFTNSPIGFEVVSADVILKPTVFESGNLRIEDGLEADMFPRPGGNRLLTTADWTLVGSMVAGLTNVSTASEFARADCAPIATRGDGRLTAADWTQAGRYVAGIDGPKTTGGPTSPAAGPASSMPTPGVKLLQASARQLKVINTEQTAGKIVSVPIQLIAQGNENSLGFSVAFDPAKLLFKAARNGGAAPSAQVILNTRDADRGRLGVLIGLSPGQVFPKGALELLVVDFAINETSPAGDTLLSFSDQPVAREVVTAEPAVLPVQYVDGAIKIAASTAPRFMHSNRRESDGAIELNWSALPGQYRLEASSNLSEWKAVSELNAIDGTIRYLDTLATQHRARFFRLIKSQ